MNRSAAVCALVVSLLPFFLSGCGVSGGSSAPVASPSVVMKGKIQGGQQPVSGATIQLYAVGATNGGGATPLLKTTPVTTDRNGGFSITNNFDCPAADPLVYLVATGGDPGMGANNSAIGMMAALGNCSALSASTFIFVDEVTTVAAAAALAPYMTAPANVGAADQTALAQAFQLAREYADTTTGLSPGAGYSGTPTTYSVTIPAATINTLANILASCINSAGTSSPSCTQLGSLTNGSTDTLTAIVKIMQNPGLYNTAGLFALATATGPFQPQLSTAPVTFGVSEQPPTTDSSLIFAFPATVSRGDTLWLVAKQYPPCPPSGPYIYTLLNHNLYAISGTAQCGMINSTIPQTAVNATQSAEWLVWNSTLTSVLYRYSTYVSIVPKPTPTYAFKPNAAFWEGDYVSHSSYNITVIFNNTTGANVTLGTASITGPDAADFKVANSYCENAVVNSSGGCSVDLTFLPPDQAFRYATFSMPVTDAGGNVSYITVQLGGSGQYHA